MRSLLIVLLFAGCDMPTTKAVNTQPQPQPHPQHCPCCGLSQRCQGICGKPGCTCPSGQNSAASTVGKTADLPQFTTQRVYECRNGVCGWYDVQVPTIRAGSQRIRVYLQPNYMTANNGNNASLAMRRAIGEQNNIEWLYGQPPAVNGRATWPTAVKPDGSYWASGDWTDSSADEFRAWAR